MKKRMGGGAMGFWIFMFVTDLLTPLLMILGGKFFLSNPPKKINGMCGYRTSMSMKNQETWYFANTYCGKLWQKIGWWMLLPSIALHIPFVHSGEGAVAILGGILCTIQCVTLLLSIIPVEQALKKNFDANGKRRL